ncbi:transglycosylase SLT domain-containing protein [Bosea sp. PAMC 26642]|uniref:transglycosylase SLT domain-containing protein n=1 Tax=Bosea sp. (strain PAMC 26642) TaxID=1792307 RepID=UPI00076FE445|nr:transglycosylase SLT domain-containing protein [Bosea sp. PAMC 26642]AMJ62801.1 hypothetical protein AXW83_23150 [Bosea sp. PAMC 26642]
MNQHFKDFQTEFPEDRCLDVVMRARHGGDHLVCRACGREATFMPRPKLRGYACPHCNFLVYPGVGTPLQSRRTTLQLWFFALKLASAQRGKAAAMLERDAAVSPVLARRMIDDLDALAKDAGSSVWLEAIRGIVAGKQLGLSRTDRLAGRERATDRGAARPSDAGAMAETVFPAQRGGPVVIALCAAGIVALVAIAGLVIATRQLEPSALPVTELDVPDLKLAARPSLILSSVESDLEAARQATQFADRNDPSLAAIREQGDTPEEPPDLGKVQPPPNILLVPPRVPSGTPLPAGRPIARPPAGGGDPEQILTFGPIRIRRHLVDTIVRAGRIVGADPTLLMAVADKESSFATAVQAKTSSATGLYQFIEQTWLGVVAEFGLRHGLQAEARLISRSGRQYTVADAGERQRILDMRREPYISALLAAEMLKRDTLRLEKAMGRHLTGGEIYLIHFLGPDAAQTFIATMEETPGAKAAELLPRPAQANRPIFYAEAGGETKTLSVSEVHKKFNDMIKLRLDRYGDVRKLWVQGAQK